MSYYEKYLKYKTKYLNLKAQIGGGDEECPILSKEGKFCKELPSDLTKEFDYLSYAYACATKPALIDLKSNQDKILEEMKTKLAGKKKIAGENNVYFKVLEAKYKESKDKIYGKLATDLFDYIKKNSLITRISIDKDMVNKAAPTLAKAFRGISQKQLGSMWIDK